MINQDWWFTTLRRSSLEPPSQLSIITAQTAARVGPQRCCAWIHCCTAGTNVVRRSALNSISSAASSANRRIPRLARVTSAHLNSNATSGLADARAMRDSACCRCSPLSRSRISLRWVKTRRQTRSGSPLSRAACSRKGSVCAGGSFGSLRAINTVCSISSASRAPASAR